MANAKISNNSVFVPTSDITSIDGLAGYTGSGNVKITGTALKASVLTGAITSITASAPLSRTAGNTPTISISQADATTDGYLSSSDWVTFNSKGSGTVTAVTGTAPVSVTSGNTPVVSMSAANGSTNGYLTSTDWTTFNSKSNFSGAYADLTGKPTIPTNNNQLTNGAGYITSSSLPTVGNGTLTITVDGSASTFTANQSTNTNISFTTGSGTSIPVSDEGTQITAGVTSFNFVGAGVTATNSSNDVTVTIPGGSSGSGTVTSVSALTLGTSGTDLSSSVADSTTTPVITLNVPSASASNRGALTSADWTTFNNKTNNTGTVTQIIASSPLTGGTITSSGTIGIPQAGTAADGYLSQTDWNTFNDKTDTTGTVTNVSGTAPISVTNGNTTPAISISQASTSVNGFLSATNWTTFNNKQDELVSGTNIKTINGNSILGSGNLVVSGSANNNTITLTAGTGLTGGGSFTLNQSSDDTITFNNSITNNNQLTNGSNFITASSSDTLTNKSGSNSQWTNDAGYITSASLPTVNDGELTITVDGTATTFTANQSGNSSVSITTGGGSGTVTEVTANTPLSVTSGTSTPDLSIAQANTSTSGFLSSTDWNTFNNKGSGTVTGSGTALTLPIFSTTTALGDSAISQTSDADPVVTIDSSDIRIKNKITHTQSPTDTFIGFTADDKFEVTTDNTQAIVCGTAGEVELKQSGVTVAKTINHALQLTGNGVSFQGRLRINCQQNNHYVDIIGPDHASNTAVSYTMQLPNKIAIQSAYSTGGRILEINAAGEGQWIATPSDTNDNYYVTGASYSAGTLTLTRNGGLADVTATGFLQIGTSSTTALAGDTTTITTAQANEITANTAKVGITTAQANEITANTAKVGITTQQASDITTNNGKVTFPGFGTTAGRALEGDTEIPAAANNSTITIAAGTNLTGGGSFTTNQSGNSTITLNASGGGGGYSPTTSIENTNGGDVDLYDDGVVRLWLDDGSSDDIELEITNFGSSTSSTYHVSYTNFDGSSTSTTTVDLNESGTTSTTTLDFNFTTDEVMALRIWSPRLGIGAGSGSGFPYYEATLIKSSSLYTGFPLLTSVLKST